MNEDDPDCNMMTVVTTTATTTTWRQLSCKQLGDHNVEGGTKMYIEQLKCIVTKPQTMFTHSPEQVVALPPPTLHIRELDQEVPSCFARTTNCGSNSR
ncbi:hypothetical protein EDB83DRAFT_2537490 [Lactarius deliciosus]|nr:hypothetical protein EDB83DRAFT_2537490 [Lactarius deliciosus]